MKRVYIHPFAGVLSAYGMGLADLRTLKEAAVETRLTDDLLPDLTAKLAALAAAGRAEMETQGIDADRIAILRKAHVKYEGTDSALVVPYGDHTAITAGFEAAHHQRYGFVVKEKPLIVEAVSVEVIGATDQVDDPAYPLGAGSSPQPLAVAQAFMEGVAHATPLYERDAMQPGQYVDGPAIIREATDPVMLEVFNNLFMAIAEQMGVALQNTAYSVNIKERLDFSCAIFDRDGALIANAPHMPVHLGSMGESVKTVIAARGADSTGKGRDGRGMKPGDVYVLNAPYAGGTHLPDVTVITPVFAEGDRVGRDVLFYVASRGHQADIGGLTPGSMPPDSRTVEEEGVLIDNFLLVDAGRFREAEMVALLSPISRRRSPPARRGCRSCIAWCGILAAMSSLPICGTSKTMPKRRCAGFSTS